MSGELGLQPQARSVVQPQSAPLGELLALSWEGIDFENATISIRRSMQKVHNKNVLGEPKSEKARRQVAVPAFVLRALEQSRGVGVMFVTRNGTPFLHATSTGTSRRLW